MSTITKELWGKAHGKEIYKYKMVNASGAYVVLGSVGAAIVEIHVPDKDGKLGDVVIGYPAAESYFADGPCSGKVPGRYANRIAKGHLEVDGKVYELPINNGPNHLHGGPEGFQNQVWDSRVDGDAVEFMYFSQDGEMGYPGNLKVTARYIWTENNELELTFAAQTDAPTVVNLTNHVYFNLDGEGAGSIEKHLLRLNASEYLPTDNTLIPLGESEPVAGTPMDFVTEKEIGRDLRADFPAINYGKGFDAYQLRQGLRCLLGDRRKDRRPAGGGGGTLLAGERAHVEGLHHPAGRADLHRQLAERLPGGQERAHLPRLRCRGDRVPALPGQPQQGGLSIHPAAAGGDF